MTSKDNNSSNPVKKRTRTGGNTVFLDNIEVTPGSVVTSKQKSSSATTRNMGSENAKPKTTDPLFNVQNASYLQLKYSVLIGVPVDRLNNISLLDEIDKWWGTKYCLGGSTENCLDCSAFTQILYRDVYNNSLPRTAQEQYNASQKVEVGQLQEADLVFFHTTGKHGKSITHVGIYLQNNKFVHAATSGGVMISDLNDKYWQPKFRGAGRLH
jgi:cell wall-associated NlpC family hydrolase